jgi:hypothetical protein
MQQLEPSMVDDPDKPDSVRNWGYFYDSLDVFKAKHNEGDWKHVLAEVRLVQRSSPSYPELVPMGHNVFRFMIDQFPGDLTGLIFVVDFELDENGVMEPVMGGHN